MTGVTLTYNNLSNITFMDKNNDEILIFDEHGCVYYKFEGEMVKVNCPDDIIEAFYHTILNYTGQEPEDVVIENYLERISNHPKSDDYMNKLEKVFRKYKLKKLQSK